MPKTYDIAGGASISQVRLTIADTSESQAIFTDAEITDALGRGGDVPSASAILLRTLAAAALRRGDAAAAQAYMDLAESLAPSVVTLEVGQFGAMPFDSGFTEIATSEG